jgi:hypothetical protein
MQLLPVYSSITRRYMDGLFLIKGVLSKLMARFFSESSSARKPLSKKPISIITSTEKRRLQYMTNLIGLSFFRSIKRIRIIERHNAGNKNL